MAMDSETGEIRPLEKVEDLLKGEVLFTAGELISVKGCVFSVEEIYPNPDNILKLKGQPAKAKEANMI